MTHYDDLCTHVREETDAEGVVVIVINGERGSGFSCQASPELTAELPMLLEDLARQIRGSSH